MKRLPILSGALIVALLVLAAPVAYAQDVKVKVVSVTSPITAGSKATLTVQTDPNARCTPQVQYRSGTGRAKGLSRKTADDQGMVSWTWLVSSATMRGTWPIHVRCTSQGQQGMVDTSITVR